jgi:hypothetical protein
MSLARFREKPKEWAARIKQWAAKVRAWWAATRLMAWWRRRRRRSHQVIFPHGITSAQTFGTPTITTRGMRGPFTPRAGQSLEDQLHELGLLVNRLREEILKEPLERERAIAAERNDRRKDLRAEAEERERRIAEMRRDVEKLRDVTTGDLGLKVESVLYLAAGIILTAWPDLVAEWLPHWLPFRVILAIVVGWPVLRFTWLRGPLVDQTAL